MKNYQATTTHTHTHSFPPFSETIMSLAAQLSKIAAPSSGVTQKRNTRASILYTPREAADISLDQLYETAQNAFIELCRVDPHLERFESSLFSPTARNTNRELSDASTNKQLDIDIANFLRAVSPYLLLSFTPHALEYLIRRFEVHLYNVESMLECILPFHETPLFSKVLALLSLQDDSRWTFLHKAQRSRVPMDRQTVVDALVRNVALVDFIWSMGQRVVGSDNGSSSSSSSSRTSSSSSSSSLVALSSSASKSTLTFCTVVLVETIRRVHSYGSPETTSNFIRRSIPHMMHSIRTKRSHDYMTMGYILTTQLCRSFVVATNVHTSLSEAVATSILRSSASSVVSKRKKEKKKTKTTKTAAAAAATLLTCDVSRLRRALTCLASMHTSCSSRSAAQDGGALPLSAACVDLLSRDTR